MSPGGGEAARSGFNYQDLAAATYFVTDIDATKLEIEPDNADFSYESVSDDISVEHYFEVKKRGSGHFTWGNFKDAISDNFSEIAAEKHDQEVRIQFGLITNCTFDQTLQSFVDDLDMVRSEEMTPTLFKNKHQRARIRALKKSTGLEGSEFDQLLNSLYGFSNSRRELELELKDFLRDCHSLRHTHARKVIRSRLGEIEKGVLTRQDLRREVGFSLEPRDAQSSSSNGRALGPIIDELEEISEKQESELEEMDREEHFRYVEAAEDYSQWASQNMEKESRATKRSSNLEEGATKIAEGQRLMHEGREEVKYWADAMVDLASDGEEDD